MAEPSQGTSVDFLDINRLARTLLARWKMIALGTGLCAVLAGAGTVALSVARPEYRAAVDVVVLPDEVMYVHDKPAQQSGQLIAMLGLVRQGSVAAAVRDRLGASMPGVSAASLLSRIDAELVSYLGDRGDLIHITATADTPQSAIWLGDLWAEEFVSHVNGVYEPVPPSVFAAMEAELAAAQATLAAAQSQLEAFLGDNNPAAMARQLEANATLVAQLWAKHSPDSAHGSTTQTAEAPGRADAKPSQQAGLPSRIADLERSSGDLAARIEATNGTLAKLTLDRDTAAAALEGLRRKKADLSLENITFLGEVRVASRAVVTGSGRQGPLRSAIVAALLALPFFALLALVVPRRGSDAA